MNDLNIGVLVNKDNLLPSNYVPSNLVVLDYNENNFHNYIDPMLKPMVREDIIKDLFKMFNDAKKSGYSLLVDSGYRSYYYQLNILNYNIEKYGEEWAYNYVALPGASEHQTGLCFDIAYMYDGIYFDDVKESDPEIKWMINNSYKYGFILRYPKGKEEITGYFYEPWHYRYVGKELAKILYENNETLEEFYSRKKTRKDIFINKKRKRLLNYE